jgi:hypothetical protein
VEPSVIQVNELLQAGDEYFARGQYREALAQFAAVLRQQPDVAAHCHRTGLALWRLGQNEAARRQFQNAIRLNPSDAQSHGELGRVLLAMGQIGPALEHATTATHLAPTDAGLAIALAAVLEASGRREEAFAIVDRQERAGHSTTDLAMVMARLSRGNRCESRALSLIETLLKRKPSVSNREASALHFAAANLLDGQEQYDAAFTHATSANELRGSNYDAAQTEKSFQGFIDYFSPTVMARLPAATHGSELPVFIVGMPRSGTSLVEQILASHPAVHGGGELDWIGRLFETAVQRLSFGSEPSLSAFDQMTESDANALAAEYLGQLTALKPGAIRITDKMPTNFVHLGFIDRLFPQARIIHCRRDAMDVGLSCFMTDFAAGYEFSFSQSGIGHFHRQYERLMSHWKQALTVRMIDVQYEELVNDVEGQARRMVEFLGLSWDAKCLAFHANDRFTGTASHAQVRRPIYRSSVGRWKHYEKFLAPLKAALGFSA